MRRNKIELSKELRLRTLYYLLQGKDIHEIAMDERISHKTVKYRLGLLYKFYKVKNRIELMALYVNIPLEIRNVMRKKEIPIIRRTEYKTTEQTGPLSKGINPLKSA